MHNDWLIGNANARPFAVHSDLSFVESCSVFSSAFGDCLDRIDEKFVAALIGKSSITRTIVFEGRIDEEFVAGSIHCEVAWS